MTDEAHPTHHGKGFAMALMVQRLLHLNPRMKVALFTREGYAGEVVGVNLPAPLAEPKASNMTVASLQNFWDMLSKHDWFYSFSDDSSVYRRGEQKEKELRTVSNLSPEHQKLWESYRVSVFQPGPHNPKPDRPRDET